MMDIEKLEMYSGTAANIEALKEEIEALFQESTKRKEMPSEPETSTQASNASGKSRIQQLLEQVLDENY